jgi:hypothetical protein
MKTMWMVLVVAVGLVWSASWVSACDGCGCKGKAKDEAAKAAATEAPAKCVACPKAQAAGDGKEAVKCPGDCKEGCCKGACKDEAKCAACKAGAEAKGCQAKADGTAAKSCPAAAETKSCGAAKTCPAAAAAETKAADAAAGN